MLESIRQRYHCQFDDIRRCSLNGRVDGFPFLPLAHGVIGAGLKIGEITAPSEQCFHVALFGCQHARIIQPGFHLREMVKVGFDIVFGFRQCEVGRAGQTKRAHTVDEAEVDSFGVPALVLFHLFKRDIVNRGGGGSMNILPLSEGFQHCLVLRDVRHDAQLYLGIVD